jgi:hypothetical protein
MRVGLVPPKRRDHPDPLGRRSAPSREAGEAGVSGTQGAGVGRRQGRGGAPAGKEEAAAGEEVEQLRRRAWAAAVAECGGSLRRA